MTPPRVWKAAEGDLQHARMKYIPTLSANIGCSYDDMKPFLHDNTGGNNAACLITMTIVFLKHTVRCARYYKICSRVSLSPLHHFDVTIKQFAGRSRMCRS